VSRRGRLLAIFDQTPAHTKNETRLISKHIRDLKINKQNKNVNNLKKT
jgi:hypothetical protein